MRRPAASIAVFTLPIATLFAQYANTPPPPAQLQRGYNAISIPEAKSILTFLSGPECEGRGSGQPGFQKAADFVAKRFRDAGLKPMGDNGTYFQSVIFTRSRVVPGSGVLSMLGKGQPMAADRFRLTDCRNQTDVVGLPLIVRYTGDRARVPDDGVFNKRIVILVGDVPNRGLASQASFANAAAIITVDNKLPDVTWNARMGKSTPSDDVTPRGILTQAGLQDLLDAGDEKLPAAPATGKTEATLVSQNLRLVGKRAVEQVPVPNVIGLLEGSDPSLKTQVIGIGGHLDHLGKHGDVVYPGADDDGSGSTAVMLIARAMAANPHKPRRSILFMTFFGEEMGLLGSSYLSKHLPIPADQWDAELQMDMVARDSYGAQNGDPSRMDKVEENIDTIRLVGSKRISTELDQTIQDVNRYVGFKFRYDAEDVYTRSDHYNFARLGIPIAFLFDGFTPDYHQPSDTVDKIDFVKLTKAAQLYYLTAYAVGDRQETLKKDVASK